MEDAIEVRSSGCGLYQARPFLVKIQESSKANSRGSFFLRDLSQSRFFVVTCGGVEIGAYALVEHDSELEVVAAAGNCRGFSLATAIDLLICKSAEGRRFKKISFWTLRRGLVRRAIARGFVLVASDEMGYMKMERGI